MKRTRCSLWLKVPNEYGHCDKIPGQSCPKATTAGCWVDEKRKKRGEAAVKKARKGHERYYGGKGQI